jgi:hypothetical protein
MKKNNGLQPHKEKIVLSKIDKIIFSLGAAGYAIAFLLEIRFSAESNYISSGIVFLIAKAIQNKKKNKLIFLKQKLVFALTLIIGFILTAMGIYWIISLF